MISLFLSAGLGLSACCHCEPEETIGVSQMPHVAAEFAAIGDLACDKCCDPEDWLTLACAEVDVFSVLNITADTEWDAWACATAEVGSVSLTNIVGDRFFGTVVLDPCCDSEPAPIWDSGRSLSADCAVAGSGDVEIYSRLTARFDTSAWVVDGRAEVARVRYPGFLSCTGLVASGVEADSSFVMVADVCGGCHGCNDFQSQGVDVAAFSLSRFGFAGSALAQVSISSIESLPKVVVDRSRNLARSYQPCLAVELDKSRFLKVLIAGDAAEIVGVEIEKGFPVAFSWSAEGVAIHEVTAGESVVFKVLSAENRVDLIKVMFV